MQAGCDSTSQFLGHVPSGIAGLFGQATDRTIGRIEVRHLPLAGDFFHQDPQRQSPASRPRAEDSTSPSSRNFSRAHDRNSRDFHGIHIAENGSLRHPQFCRQLAEPSPGRASIMASNEAAGSAGFRRQIHLHLVACGECTTPRFAPSTYHSSRVRTEGFESWSRSSRCRPRWLRAKQLTNHSGWILPVVPADRTVRSNPSRHGQSVDDTRLTLVESKSPLVTSNFVATGYRSGSTGSKPGPAP